MFWAQSTFCRAPFNSRAGKYNFSWSHPCLRILHKVIRLSFLGQTEVNKVPTTDLQCIWSFTPGCQWVMMNWRELFLAAIKRFQTTPWKGRVPLGGLVTLIGDHLELPRPIEKLVQQHYRYDYPRLFNASVLKIEDTRYYHIYGSKSAYAIELPCPMPFGPRYDDFNIHQLAELAEAPPPPPPPRQQGRGQGSGGDHRRYRPMVAV